MQSSQALSQSFNHSRLFPNQSIIPVSFPILQSSQALSQSFNHPRLFLVGQKIGQDYGWPEGQNLQRGGEEGRLREPGQVPLGDQGHAQCLCYQVSFMLMLSSKFYAYAIK